MAKLTEERGDLVGAMIVGDDDEVLVVMERGKVVRSAVARASRPRAGTRWASSSPSRTPATGSSPLARNTERGLGADDEELPAAPDGPALDAAAGAGTDPDAEPGVIDEGGQDAPGADGDGDAS